MTSASLLHLIAVESLWCKVKRIAQVRSIVGVRSQTSEIQRKSAAGCGTVPAMETRF